MNEQPEQLDLVEELELLEQGFDGWSVFARDEPEDSPGSREPEQEAGEPDGGSD